MSLIFDGFPTQKRAEAFALAVQSRHQREASVFTDENAAYEHDPFPFPLTPPVVHVERSADCGGEGAIRALVREFGGSFAGT